MSTSPNTVPKTVVDKNGRTTTVHVNPNRSVTSKAKALPVPSPAVSPIRGLATGPRSAWRVNDYIFERSRIHTDIATRYGMGAPYSELESRIAEREEMYRTVSQWANASHEDSTPIALTNVVINSSFIEGKERYGYSNDLFHPEESRDDLRLLSSAISEAWLESCSSAEALALVKYAGGSEEYAKMHGEGALAAVWDDFESAVSRSPEVEPFVVYTGVNEHYVAGILAQVESGEVVLDRVFSSSLNPAQVNGFATGEHSLALEVETTKGAFMDVVSHVPDEMEVMLPKGRYEVLATDEGVKYFWGDSRESGGTMEKTIRLRYLGE